MARGSRNRNRYSERDLHISLTPSPRVARVVPLSQNLSLIQDLRTFDFEPATRPVLSLGGRVASYTAANPVKGPTRRTRSLLPGAVAFKAPSQVLVCVRRKKRKEVLFAKKKTGRGARSKFRRRNYFSNVRC